MKYETLLFGFLMSVLTIFATVSFAAIQFPASSDAEGYVYTEFGWVDDGYHKMYLSVPVADSEGYKNSVIPRMHCPVAADRFITEDATIREIADRFDDITTGRSDQYRVSFVNRFIGSCISYKTDPEVHGHCEYFQYPIETLLLRSGDCEDMAILETAILRAMGYDAILLIGDEHALSGVNVDADGRYTSVFGKRYYHLEPTSGDAVGVSDSGAIPHLPIYKYIVFALFVAAAVLCFMAISGMVWKEDGSIKGRRMDEEISDIGDGQISGKTDD